MTEAEIVRVAYATYRKAGLTDAGIWGMLGNAKCESGLIPYRLQGDFSGNYESSLIYTRQVDSGAVSRDAFVNRGPNGGGYGLYQTTYYTRKAGLYDMAKATGRSIGDLSLHLDYSLHELKTEFSGNVWPVLIRTNDIKEASDIVCRVYENPQVKNYDPRYNAAIWLRDKYHSIVSADDSIAQTEETVPAASVGVEIAPVGEPVIVPATESFPPRMIDNVHCEGWPEIWLAQALLKCRAYSVTIDGIFGKNMTDKVKEFQTHQQLDADGVIGKKTWEALGVKM